MQNWLCAPPFVQCCYRDQLTCSLLAQCCYRFQLARVVQLAQCSLLVQCCYSVQVTLYSLLLYSAAQFNWLCALSLYRAAGLSNGAIVCRKVLDSIPSRPPFGPRACPSKCQAGFWTGPVGALCPAALRSPSCQPSGATGCVWGCCFPSILSSDRLSVRTSLRKSCTRVQNLTGGSNPRGLHLARLGLTKLFRILACSADIFPASSPYGLPKISMFPLKARRRPLVATKKLERDIHFARNVEQVAKVEQVVK